MIELLEQIPANRQAIRNARETVVYEAVAYHKMGRCGALPSLSANTPLATNGMKHLHTTGWGGTVRVFNHGFCCVRASSIGLRLWYGACFSTKIYTRGCH
jgi:hypothetical protein